jgi:putative cardiolipin synthase
MDMLSGIRRILACGLLAAITGCASLPDVVERPTSSALTDTSATRLGRALAAEVAAHPDKTGVHALSGAREAFAARVLLAHAAERSIDAQYYIWHDDTTGGLLDEALWAAAERGVRVRLLLDDQNTRGRDDVIAVLDSHPNIEVRLFNPFANRSFRLADFAGDFSRVNRRMHNKSYTVDNQASIVGGRNIGDEYFGAGEDLEFEDLDALIAGAVVHDVSREFDEYWNSPSAYPAASLISAPSAETVARVRSMWAAIAENPSAIKYVQAVRDTPLVQEVLGGTVALEWVPARLVADDPAKVLHPPEATELHMLPHLEAALGKPMTEIDLVSPYFVPTVEGTQTFLAVASRGVKVRVLTNSLAATDVSPVYAGYAKYRRDLLQGGVQLFELKRDAPTGSETADRRRGSSISGSSSSGLHAKTFAVDRRRIFIGSFNLDPRSARLNTEMGVVLESPNLATHLSELFDTKIRLEEYEVRLTADGQHIEWVDRASGSEKTLSSAPDTSVFRRMWAGFLGILPIEWLL